jgi:hypothetical protein
MFKRGNKGNLEAHTARRATLTLLDLRFHCGIFLKGKSVLGVFCIGEEKWDWWIIVRWIRVGLLRNVK